MTPISQQPLNLDRQYDDQLPLRMPNAGNLLTVSQMQCWRWWEGRSGWGGFSHMLAFMSAVRYRINHFSLFFLTQGHLNHSLDLKLIPQSAMYKTLTAKQNKNTILYVFVFWIPLLNRLLLILMLYRWAVTYLSLRVCQRSTPRDTSRVCQ